jgi:hypothetical protein
MGVVQVVTHKLVLLSAYIFSAMLWHLYLHVFVPLESICPYVSGAPKHLITQYRDVGSANPDVHFCSHFFVELSINNPDGHNETHLP